jgi:RIO kinase 1
MASIAPEHTEQPEQQPEVTQNVDAEQKPVAVDEERDEDIEDLFEESADDEIVPELISADGNDYTKSYNRQRRLPPTTSQNPIPRNRPPTRAQQSTTRSHR